jgi:hypothetical protein
VDERKKRNKPFGPGKSPLKYAACSAPYGSGYYLAEAKDKPYTLLSF